MTRKIKSLKSAWDVQTLSKNRTKQTAEKNCSVLLKTVYLGMSIGQEKKYPKWGVKGKDLGVCFFGREFPSCFRKNSVGHQEHDVTQKVLGVDFCFVL